MIIPVVIYLYFKPPSPPSPRGEGVNLPARQDKKGGEINLNEKNQYVQS
jgi:hypothetical protein